MYFAIWFFIGYWILKAGWISIRPLFCYTLKGGIVTYRPEKELLLCLPKKDNRHLPDIEN